MKIRTVRIVMSALLICLSIVAGRASAQESDWYDSIQSRDLRKKERQEEKRIRRQQKKEFNKADTSLISPSIGMCPTYSFIDQPALCGFYQRHCIRSDFRYNLPLFNDRRGQKLPYASFVSYDAAYGARKKIACGFGIIREQGGFERNSTINNSFSYKFRIPHNNYIRAGIGIDLGRYSLDWDHLIFPDQIDQTSGYVYHTAELQPGGLSINYIAFNGGLLFTRKNLFAGISVRNIFKHNIAFISMARSHRIIDISGGYSFQVSPKCHLLPSAQLIFEGKSAFLNIHCEGIFYRYLLAEVSLTDNRNLSLALGFTINNWMIFKTSAGFFTERELGLHFGPIQYISSNLCFLFGKYQKKW